MRRFLSTSTARRPLKLAQLRAIRPDGATTRFYDEVSVKRASDFDIDLEKGGVGVPELPGALQAERDGWLVCLDGRGLSTPFGNLFVLPSETLAHAVACEWSVQESHVKPVTMPLMKLASTAIDIIPSRRDKTVAGLLRFLRSDAVCFFADPATEPGLWEMQDEQFSPIIEWFQQRYGVTLSTNREQPGMLIVTQSEETAQHVSQQLHTLDNWRLSALDQLSGETKSLSISCMAMEGHLGNSEALEASKTEEVYQSQRCGEVPAGQDLDRGFSRLVISSATFFAHVLQESDDSKYNAKE